jgi:peptidoglycan/xylan/chitin deacetylase (PgdA/CDA1 family)
MQIVMYHYIKQQRLAPGEEPWFLPADQFERQLDFFQQQYEILHPQQLLKPHFVPSERHVLLTFDDGLADHFETVFPILQRRGLSGLFFLNGLNYEQHRLLNVHRIHYLSRTLGWKQFQDEATKRLQLVPVKPTFIDRFRDVAYQGLHQTTLLSNIKSHLNFYLAPADQERVLSDLMQELDIDEAALAADYYISQSQAAEMQAAGMCFGGHGYTHYVLSNLSAATQQSEVQECMQWLERWLPNAPLPVFCFPYGYRQSYNQDTGAALAKAGIQVGFCVENRAVTGIDWQHGRWHLPRLDCNRFIFNA